MFKLNQALIQEARTVLFQRTDISWIIGGSCSGKSTVSRAISNQTGTSLYDMDAHIFDEYMGQYDRGRHPASTAWFSAPNPFEWAFSLAPDTFDALNRAANGEYLDLLATDLAGQDQPLLIDGGITHPEVLAQVIRPQQIVCLEISEETRVRAWENEPERATMKSWVHEMPDPERQWSRFLDLDQAMSHKIVSQSRELGIKVFFREDNTPVDHLAKKIASYFELEHGRVI